MLSPVHPGEILNGELEELDLSVSELARKIDVPTNRLHAQGYPSVGCAPCSRAVAPGADLRSGRWWWEQAETRECGIHTGEEEQGSGI